LEGDDLFAFFCPSKNPYTLLDEIQSEKVYKFLNFFFFYPLTGKSEANIFSHAFLARFIFNIY
jgi:hypothetical protein